MKTRAIPVLLFLLSLIFAACSDDNTPTNSGNGGQQFLADTTTHLATDILTFYGGNGWDWGTAVAAIPGGGYAVSGSTDSWGVGKNTLYVVQTDSTGKVLWSKIFGGAGEDNAEAMALTADDNLIIGGVTSSFSGSYDFYLIKVTLQGNLLWEKSIGGSDFDWGTDLAVLNDGYAMCGYTIPGGGLDGGNFMLVRTDLNGNVLWTKTYESPDREWPFALTATSDGGFLLAGYVHYDGTTNVDMYAIKTDDTGGVEWENAYGGTGDDKVFAATECAGGGYVLAGSTRSFGLSNQEMDYVVKIDAGGTLVWDEYFGNGGNMRAQDILENPDGTFMLTGNTSDVGTGTGMAKIDAAGNLLWNENIGLYSSGMSLIRDGDGKYFVTGFALDSVGPNVTDVLLMHLTER